MDPYNELDPAASVRVGSTTTLVEGRSFCLSDETGQMDSRRAEGVFFADTRFVADLTLSARRLRYEHLATTILDPHASVIVGRFVADESELLVVRRRYVGHGMREDFEVEVTRGGTVDVVLELRVGTDFAHIFSVKSGRVEASPAVDFSNDGGQQLSIRSRTRPRGLKVRSSHRAEIDAGTLRWTFQVSRGSPWQTCVEYVPILDGVEQGPSHRCGESVAAAIPVLRLGAWRRRIPRCETGVPFFDRSISQAFEDLAALRIFDPSRADRAVIAAGAPWYMTLFGRDSLLSAWMALPFAPDLARGVLQTLAELQGTVNDPGSDQEPGKILHEIRQPSGADMNFRAGEIYYGTVDATPLFVMTAVEAWRWGALEGVMDVLLPAIRKAITWLETFGDLDGDGFVEYQRRASRGLDNQGWKDSWDGVTNADGSIPGGPIALAEVQGYAYAAFLGAAELEAASGDRHEARRLRGLAARLRTRFNQAFWMDDRGFLALALDGDKRPVDSMASNAGHCLWTGIVDEDKADVIATRLVSPEMASGWGLRTLATDMAAYDPLSYHNGSVWPHDTAVAVAGLSRYGQVRAAEKLAADLIAASAAHAGRLPELFSGLERQRIEVPVDYPSSCSPQAWAAASPLLLLRSLLGLDVDRWNATISLRQPVPSSWLTDVSLWGLRIGGSDVHIQTTERSVEVEGSALRLIVT